MTWLLHAYVDRRTYGSLGFLLLSLPLGIFGFVVVVTGLALGLGLIITLIGIPILCLTLLFVRGFAGLERRLASSMLQASLPRRPVRRAESRGVFWQRLRDLVGARQTWKELAYVLASLPLGVIGFALAVSLIVLMFAGIAQPITFMAGVEAQIGTWTIDTFWKSLIYLPISLLFLLVGPRILLGLGKATGRVVTWFLGYIETDELKNGVIQTLARDGELDAFSIYDQLHLRFGRGSQLSPTRVQAVLLTLESSGQIVAKRRGSSVLYRLREAV